MKKQLFLFIPVVLFLCSFGPEATVESFNYEVSIDGKPIGTYLVSRTNIDGASTLRVENTSAAGLIRKAEHKFVMLSLFDDNKLIASNVKTWVNEKLESSSELCWDGNHYLKNDGESTIEIGQQLVTYSSACVFFEEPVDRDVLFYEQYGKELEVVKIGDHKYEVKLPNGSKELYTYQDGEVVMVEVVQTFATISLIRNG
jgi:hypothetical protein